MPWLQSHHSPLTSFRDSGNAASSMASIKSRPPTRYRNSTGIFGPYPKHDSRSRLSRSAVGRVESRFYFDVPTQVAIRSTPRASFSDFACYSMYTSDLDNLSQGSHNSH